MDDAIHPLFPKGREFPKEILIYEIIATAHTPKAEMILPYRGNPQRSLPSETNLWSSPPPTGPYPAESWVTLKPYLKSLLLSPAFMLTLFRSKRPPVQTRSTLRGITGDGQRWHVGSGWCRWVLGEGTSTHPGSCDTFSLLPSTLQAAPAVHLQGWAVSRPADREKYNEGHK